SKHEHLIAFSNSKIYQGKLITFPSSIEKADDLGVEYIYVAGGTYDRGGKNGNRQEAEKVAELVFEHFKNHPNRSIRIVAFGEVQQTAIEDAILRKRYENPEYEIFFSEDREEPLFIKNLETVQGDERDTIIFSIGYAPDVTGKFLMNFGPLSRIGGERRLNVAITRARCNLKLVGSILPSDIDTDRINSLGPKLLRLYIDYAINGAKAILGETTLNGEGWFDSSFEESVYDFLTNKGYDVVTQVGCSGYRIDMAVRHPKYKGRYAIGIECDGAAYHSARTARERDRLRQTILEDMGWKIYRVWSTDWVKDPHTEREKLLHAVNSAIKEYSEEIRSNPVELKNSISFLSISTKSMQESIRERFEIIKSRYAGLNVVDIPISDIEMTMLRVLQNGFGLDKTSLFKETALYGYCWQRLGSNIKFKFEQAYYNLLKTKKIEEEKDGKIKVLQNV
ncbi:MAG: type III restriction endonuclease subunit R, partial [Clostridiales bacterium]|nr:type III restriction endonuclease subunit R [Clostridiales bacterium]